MHIFIGYVKNQKVTEVHEKILSNFLMWCEKKRGYGYSSMKQMVASLRFLYEKVLKKDIDFDFNIGMKKPSIITVVLRAREPDKVVIAVEIVSCRSGETSSSRQTGVLPLFGRPLTILLFALS